MNEAAKMLDMFELVGSLLAVKGLDSLIEDYKNAPEENAAQKHGLRLQMCALLSKREEKKLEKLCALENDKTVEEIRAMSDKERVQVYLETVMGVVAPFLARSPKQDGNR